MLNVQNIEELVNKWTYDEHSLSCPDLSTYFWHKIDQMTTQKGQIAPATAPTDMEDPD